MTTLTTICLWFGLAFSVEEMGVFAHPLNTALAATFMAIGLLLPSSKNHADSIPLQQRVLSMTAVVITAAMACTGYGELRLVALAAMFCALARFTQSDSRRFIAKRFALTCLFYAVYRVAISFSLLAWYANRWLSESISGGLGKIIGQPLALMPSMSGLGLVVLCCCWLLSNFLMSSDKRRIPALVGLASILLVYSLFLRTCAGWSQLLDSVDGVANGVAAWFYPAHMTLLLSVTLLVPMYWYQGLLARNQSNSARVIRPNRTWALISLVAAILSPLILTQWQAVPPKQSRLLVYEKGFVNWIKPTEDLHGPGSVGMMGMFPELVRAKGWQATMWQEELSAEALKDQDVLLIVSPTEQFSDKARSAVDEFVTRGGSLLFLGDHTSQHGGRFALNDCLQNKDLKFRFDNAEFTIGGWLHSYEARSQIVTAGLRDDRNEAGIVIGASLDIDYPAMPLIVGRYGHSDPGEVKNERQAFMGNRTYDPGERLGDCVLVAAQDFGDGKIVLFGDTSTFGNNIMTMTWPFVSRLLDWMVSEQRVSLPWWRDLLGLAGLFLVAFGTARVIIQPAGFGILPIILFLGISLVAAKYITESRCQPEPLRATHSIGENIQPGRAIAILDGSHGSGASKAEVEDSGLGGLGITLMRKGYLFLTDDSGSVDQREAAAVTFLVSPTDAFSPSDVEGYVRYVENGGRLIIAGGWPERRTLAPLLKAFDFTLTNRPLGRTKGTVEGSKNEPIFYRPWSAHGPEVIAKIWDDAVVVRCKRGRGEAVFVADGHFLRSRNIENEDGTIKENIAFLGDLLSPMRKN